MNRNTPRIEWAIRISQTAPKPVCLPLPPETQLWDIPSVGPLGAAPLIKANINTVGQLREALEGKVCPAINLPGIKGMGPKRIKTLLDAIAGPETAAEPAEDPFLAVMASHKALDLATEISRATLVLSSGYPKVLIIDGATYLVIRWGGPRYLADLMALTNRDKRFHKVPPLSNKDTGMVECREDE